MKTLAIATLHTAHTSKNNNTKEGRDYNINTHIKTYCRTLKITVNTTLPASPHGGLPFYNEGASRCSNSDANSSRRAAFPDSGASPPASSPQRSKMSL